MISVEAAQAAALSLPNAVLNQHSDRPDIRVRNKIFVTLWFAENRLVLKLSPESQMMFRDRNPDGFTPVKGAWGDKGWTSANLEHLDQDELEEALFIAWKQVAPKRLIKAFENRRL